MRVSGRPWISLLMLTGLLVITMETAIAQTNTRVNQSVWSSIMDWLRRPKPPFGGRGENCLLNFDRATPQVVWHRRPMLIWRGDAGAIGLQTAQDAPAFWRQSSPPLDGTGVQKLHYTGQPLELGQSYQWAFFFAPTSPHEQSWLPFMMVSGDRYQQVAQDLQQLTASLKRQQASAEQVIWQRADYFARQQLWADALQELYSVPQPSAELQRLRQQMRTAACAAKPADLPRLHPLNP